MFFRRFQLKPRFTMFDYVIRIFETSQRFCISQRPSQLKAVIYCCMNFCEGSDYASINFRSSHQTCSMKKRCSFFSNDAVCRTIMLLKVVSVETISYVAKQLFSNTFLFKKLMINAIIHFKKKTISFPRLYCISVSCSKFIT